MTPTRAQLTADPYAGLTNVNLDAVPVMSMDRGITRKEQAALTRILFKRLGLRGISVTAPSYSMAQAVHVRLSWHLPPDWAGFEQWENAAYSEMPDHVPAKQAMRARLAAIENLRRVLAVAFPNHNDRSDIQSDYFNYKWSIE